MFIAHSVPASLALPPIHTLQVSAVTHIESKELPKFRCADMVLVMHDEEEEGALVEGRETAES